MPLVNGILCFDNHNKAEKHNTQPGRECIAAFKDYTTSTFILIGHIKSLEAVVLSPLFQHNSITVGGCASACVPTVRSTGVAEVLLRDTD